MNYQKTAPIKSQKLRDSARGKDCTLQFHGCRNDTNTVVLCHSPLPEHSQGVGQKSHDILGVYGCQWCHDILDRRSKYLGLLIDEPLQREYWSRAHQDTMVSFITSGLMVVK